MTIKEIKKLDIFTDVCTPEDERAIDKIFCCDLLSIAMSKAPSGSAWVTVMSNVNTLAVASLADVALIVIAEGAAVDETLIEKAKEQGINIMKTELPIFEAAMKLQALI